MRCAFIVSLLATSTTYLVSASPIPAPAPAPAPAPNGGDAYTGAAGSATGGDAWAWNTDGGLVGLDNNNAGNGGKATSGSAFGGDTFQPGANAGNAYSGVGGNTDGGDARIVNPDSNYHNGLGIFKRFGRYYDGYDRYDGLADGLLDGVSVGQIGNGNGGNGGDSSSGDAVGGTAWSTQ